MDELDKSLAEELAMTVDEVVARLVCETLEGEIDLFVEKGGANAVVAMTATVLERAEVGVITVDGAGMIEDGAGEGLLLVEVAAAVEPRVVVGGRSDRVEGVDCDEVVDVSVQVPSLGVYNPLLKLVDIETSMIVYFENYILLDCYARTRI